MTLDKQIILMEELISDDDHWSNKKAKSDYRQLLKWLKDYKRLLERPKGEWKYNQYDGNPNIGNWHCSECRHIESGSYKQKPNANFCPNCGADMRKGGEV